MGVTSSATKTHALIASDSIQFASMKLGDYTQEAVTYKQVSPARLETRQASYQGQLVAMEGAALAQKEMEFFIAGQAKYAEIEADVAAKFAAEERAKRQAEQRRAEERRELLGQLLQGALIAGKGYASGMQEANQANARSQAIINAAAESDRQYQAAQAADVLAQRVPRQQSVPPAQQAEASTRSGAPPAVLHTATGGGTRAPATVYYSCKAATKKTMPNGADGFDTIYYGIVTATGHNIEGAEDLFRQQTVAGRRTHGEGGGCHPNSTRAEAEGLRNRAIARDRNGGWPQITVDLALPGVGKDYGSNF